MRAWCWLLCWTAIGCGPIDGRGTFVLDAGPLDPDSRVAPFDASGFDAGALDGGSPDSGFHGTPCNVLGVAGTCELVSDCVGDYEPTPGFCPGPAEIQCCTPRGMGCDPDDMPTPNEGLMEAEGDPGCLDGMVDVGTFCVDRYEASLVLVDDTGPIGSWSPFHNPGANRVRAVSLANAVPQGYITGVQAARACDEAGKRLCTDTEWLRACQGPEGLTYPYGATREDGVCNDARAVHPAIERFGTSDEWIWSQLGDACINQLPNSLAPTGSHSGCVTGDGAYDMMGNLHEWTADEAGTFRGGFYADTRMNGQGCLYATTAHNTDHWDYSTGFRCCASR